MKKRIKTGLTILILLFFIIIWSVLLYNISPVEIVQKIGVENGYIIAFLIAVIGGISSVTASSYYVIIGTLTAGGLNILLLGLIGGAGATISDSLFYYIGKKGKEIHSKKTRKLEKFLKKIIKKSPVWGIYLIIFVYIGLTPLPNEILTASLGLSGYKYKKAVLFIFLGNITGTIVFGYLISKGILIIF
jgi:membrane protein YqaA with SNARE-associated domain